jgi:hypothetical protein
MICGWFLLKEVEVEIDVMYEQILFFLLTISQLLCILLVQLLLGLPEHSLSDPSPTKLVTIFYVSDSINLQGQVPLFISPRNSVPRSRGSFFVASYVLQVYGGIILTFK